MPLPSWHQKDHLAILWTDLVNINISTSIEYPLVNSHNFGLNHQFSYVNQLLVGGWAYPSEKSWTSSAGIMTLPTEWTNKIHVPNHHTLSHFAMRVAFVRRYPSWVWLPTGWSENRQWKHRVAIPKRQCIKELSLASKRHTCNAQHPFVHCLDSVLWPGNGCNSCKH